MDKQDYEWLYGKRKRRNNSSKWKFIGILSLFIVICMTWIIFLRTSWNPLKYPASLPSTPSIPSLRTYPMDDKERIHSFALKHVFHRNTEPRKEHVLGRLDIDGTELQRQVESYQLADRSSDDLVYVDESHGYNDWKEQRKGGNNRDKQNKNDRQEAADKHVPNHTENRLNADRIKTANKQHVPGSRLDELGALVQPNHALYSEKEFRMRAVPKTIQRLADSSPEGVRQHRINQKMRSRGHTVAYSSGEQWVAQRVLVPDVKDKETVLTLASMAANAYVDIPYTGDWTNVSDPWDEKLGIGWMGDGVRGHVFANEESNLVVISIKGTSAAIFDSGGATAPRDKVNDNMLFSCCCARISYLWNTVCDCYTGESYTCDQECLEDRLWAEDIYYQAVLDVYQNVTARYPNAEIWVTGHSLGGALSALLGRTFGLPAVGFEAPGEQLAAQRLHLPKPPGVPIWDDHVWHFGHTADPVYMGVCNGAGSACWIGGYAMETLCHTGLQCVYDVVEDLGWHVSMVNHRIHVVIDDVISAYNQTAKCELPETECMDCFNWQFIVPSLVNPEPTTTSTIRRKPRVTSTSSTSRETVPPTDTPHKCVRWTWYGRCAEYGDDE